MTAEQGAPAQKKRQLGNPRNLEEAEVTKNIMKELHPDCNEDSEKYNRLYNEVKTIRRYGRRLKSLVDAFGLGILGLIPLVKHVSTTGQAFSITHDA